MQATNPPKSPGNPRAAAIGFFLIALALLAAIGYVIFDFVRARDAVTWPTVNGTVISSQTERRGGRFSILYCPVVRYRYVVGDKEFTSDRISFGDSQCSKELGDANFANQYRAGASVRVSHYPENPHEAVLVSATSPHGALPAIPVLLLLFVLFMGKGLQARFGWRLMH